MAQQGFGTEDFERLARQYWNQWGEAMRGAVPGATAAPGWEDALGWWSQLARSGGPTADGAVSRLDAQAREWLGRMQQVAARFAGHDASATDIAQAWKAALGTQPGGPFAAVFGNMDGRGQRGFAHWFEEVAPLLQSSDARSWLGLPAFGFAREHQERWQRLLQAQLDAQEQSQAYHALLAEAGQDAFARFERKLQERSEPGSQLTSARALFDLWVDAAEDAYADVALSPRFGDAYGAMANSQMRLRASVQEEVERIGELLGMPTRTEVDSAHRKIAQLERELRRLREQQADAGAAAPVGRPAGSAAAKRPARKRAPAKKAPAGKPARAARATARKGKR